MPHTGVDPIVIASHIITASQSIVSRNVNPLDSMVITFAMINGGTAHNIIPDEVKIVGTVRTLSPDARRLAEKRLGEICHGIAHAMGGTADYMYEHGYPVTVNDVEAADLFRRVNGEDLQPDTTPVMGGEDFSFYGQHVPACFFWLGLVSHGEQGYPNLHAPNFDFNDQAIAPGVRAMCRLATAVV